MITYKDSIKKIYVELTQKCNLNCPACFRCNWTREPADMSEAVFQKILDDDTRAETIVVGGVGEPTIHPVFAGYSKRLARKAGGNLELTSNAYNWDKDTLQAIAQYYKKVTVSVDGLPDTFQATRV